MKLIPHSLTPAVQLHGIRSLRDVGIPVRTRGLSVLYPRKSMVQGYPSRYFEENQLSLNLIGLSLLHTVHPKAFQRSAVRPSTSCY